MSEQVSVRLVVNGGNQFREEMRRAGSEGSQAMQQLERSSGAAGAGLQNAGYQIGDFATQVAGGQSAVIAFAQQFPQLIGGMGAFGAVAGAAVVVLATMAPLLMQGGQSAAEMAADMANLEGTIGSVNGAVSALEAVQGRYNDAIAAQGGASSAAASLVVANSRREFEARKTVLSVELDLLRARGAKQAMDLRDLQNQFREEGAAAMEAGRTFSAPSLDGGAEAAYRYAGVPRPRGAVEQQVEGFLARNEETRLVIRQLSAEAELTRLALEEGEEALNTTFADIGSNPEAGSVATKRAAEAKRVFDETRTSAERYAAELADLNGLLKEGAIDQDTYNRKAVMLKEELDRANAPDEGGAASGSSGKAAGAANAAAKEAQKIFDDTRTAAERYAAELAKLNGLLREGAIDQDTYNRKAAQLQGEFDSSTRFASAAAAQVKSSMSSIFDAIVEGGDAAGQVIEGLGKKLLSMALQESTFRLLARLMPGTFGADGFVPLMANAAGNAFSGGRVVPFAAGGVVSGPTLFPMRGGTGLMGEAGPEAIMPLTRIGGKLGVRAAGGGGGGTVVNVINQTGQPAREERQTGPNGEEVVRVIVGDQLAKGRHDGSMSRFGARPRKVSRG